MSLSVQCRSGCTRRCAPGGGEGLKWFQNSGGWARTSHRPWAPRGENTRSLARVASSSRRMPATKPSKPCLASASLRPSVLRGAGPGAGRTKRIHPGKFLAGIDVHGRAGHSAEEGLAREPDHHVGVFAKRPEDGNALEARERFAKDEN